MTKVISAIGFPQAQGYVYQGAIHIMVSFSSKHRFVFMLIRKGEEIIHELGGANWKAYSLPTDTCIQTSDPLSLLIYRPGLCLDVARYWDNACSSLDTITSIDDSDFVPWDACIPLATTTSSSPSHSNQIHSFAFYCKTAVLPPPQPFPSSAHNMPPMSVLPNKTTVKESQGLIMAARTSQNQWSTDAERGFMNRPTWKAVESDQCFYMNGGEIFLKIVQVPLCSNGTQALLQLYECGKHVN